MTLLPLGAAVACLSGATPGPLDRPDHGPACFPFVPWPLRSGFDARSAPITAGNWPVPLRDQLRLTVWRWSCCWSPPWSGFIISCYALGYFPVRRHHQSRARYFWPLWLFFWGGCNALFVSGDLFNLYVTLELVTLASLP
jgi:hypothetical protein